MKAPDKIYIQRYSYGALLDGYSNSPKKMADGENIAYIRKDVLIDWAKDYLKEKKTVGLSWRALIKKVKSI